MRFHKGYLKYAEKCEYLEIRDGKCREYEAVIARHKTDVFVIYKQNEEYKVENWAGLREEKALAGLLGNCDREKRAREKKLVRFVDDGEAYGIAIWDNAIDIYGYVDTGSIVSNNNERFDKISSDEEIYSKDCGYMNIMVKNREVCRLESKAPHSRQCVIDKYYDVESKEYVIKLQQVNGGDAPFYDIFEKIEVTLILGNYRGQIGIVGKYHDIQPEDDYLGYLEKLTEAMKNGEGHWEIKDDMSEE